MLLIVSFFGCFASSARAQSLHAEKIISWNFRKQDDSNLDRKPDGWKRRRDREHPAYIQMAIVAKNAEKDYIAKSAQLTLARALHSYKTGRWNPNYLPEVTPAVIADFMDRYVLDNCLEVKMNGGNAEFVTPKFPMEPRFAYSLRGIISTLELDGHDAFVELNLLDSNEQTIKVISTEAIHGTTEWTPVDTEIVATKGSDLTWGRLHIQVRKRHSPFFKGIARFDGLELYRLPQLTLSVPHAHHVASPGAEFDVTCTALGIRQTEASVDMQLLDCVGNLLRRENLPLQRTRKSRPSATPPVPKPSSRYVSKKDSSFDGEARWRLKFDRPGLYRVRVHLGNEFNDLRQREILIAIMNEHEPIQAGPFGWSLPAFHSNFEPIDVPQMVELFGAGWIKMPIWFDPHDLDTADKLVHVADRLQLLGVKILGRIDNPPQSQRQMLFEKNDDPYATTIFRNQAVWEPLLEPVLTRMGMKITWFQLAADDDMSLLGSPDPNQLVADIRSRLRAFSQELKLSVPWQWSGRSRIQPKSAWNSIHFRSSPQLTSAELESYLENSGSDEVQSWVSIDPLERKTYSLVDRVRDLTERMIVIKKAKVKAAFVANPFDNQKGILTPELQINEMSLPWHTMVSHIGNATYIGSIQLPNGSENHIFERNGEGTMVVWNQTETYEQLFLGDQLSAIDIWGREAEVKVISTAERGAEQGITTTEWPLVVTGIDVEVVKFRQKFQMEISSLASTLAGGQKIPFKIENTLSKAAIGKIVLHSDSLLSGGRAELPIQLAIQHEHRRSIPIIARSDASAGVHQLQFDLDFVAGKPYKFSVFREINLGLGEIEFLWDSSRITDDKLELRVELINHTTSSADFDCKLFLPGQPYERLTILNAKPGSTLRQISLPVSASTTGEIWIRCEQIGTGRILNYRVKI